MFFYLSSLEDSLEFMSHGKSMQAITGIENLLLIVVKDQRLFVFPPKLDFATWLNV